MILEAQELVLVTQELVLVAQEVILVTQELILGVVGRGPSQGLCFVTSEVPSGRTELSLRLPAL